MRPFRLLLVVLLLTPALLPAGAERRPLDHRDFDGWLAAGDARARFYDGISRKTRAWSAERRGDHWHSADALAMAAALQPEGVLRAEERPLAVELEGRLSRGATVVDWQQRSGRPANARIVMDYDQARFEAQIRAALGA